MHLRRTQVARLQRRYDDEGLPFPEAVSAIAMAAPIEPKPSPAALVKTDSPLADLVKMAEARTTALQSTLADRYVPRRAFQLVPIGPARWLTPVHTTLSSRAKRHWKAMQPSEHA